MPEQLRPEPKDLGEAAAKTLNLEPRTPNPEPRTPNPEPVPLVKISFQILLTSPLLLDIIILLWCK